MTANNIILQHEFIISVIVVDCGDLMDPVNGAVTLTNSTYYASVAIYSCNNGYNLVGETSRTCLVSGSWSDSAPTCTGTVIIVTMASK